MVNYTLKQHIRIGLLSVSWLILSAVCIAQPQGQRPSEEELKKKDFDIEYFDGMRSKLSGNRQEAIMHFRRALEINPKQSSVYFQLSQLYLQQKNAADAAFYAEKAVALEPSNEWYLTQLAESYKIQRQFIQAASTYEKLFTRTGNFTHLLDASMMHTLAGKLNKAIRDLDKAEKVSGFNEDYYKQREQIYLADNKLKKAIAEIQKLVRHSPENPSYQGMLADLYMSARKEKEALAIYEKLIQQDPQNGYALFAIADHYRVQGDKEQYFHYLQRGMQSDRVEIKDKLMAFTYLYSDTSGFKAFQQKVFSLSDILIQTHPTEAPAYSVRADLYVQVKNFDSARVYYSKALDLDAHSLAGWQQLLVCDQELHSSRWMKQDCEKAIQAFPAEPLFYLYASFASTQLKEYADAVSFSLRGIEFANGNERILPELLSTLGDASHYAGMNERSDSAYEASLAIDENNPYALNNYAYYLSLRNEQLDKAERMSFKSLQLDSGNASYYDTYGWILFQQGNYAKAKTYISRSLDISPNNAEVIEHLGDIWFKEGNKSEALTQWKHALELGSSNTLLPKKIQQERIDPK